MTSEDFEHIIPTSFFFSAIVLIIVALLTSCSPSERHIIDQKGREAMCELSKTS